MKKLWLLLCAVFVLFVGMLYVGNKQASPNVPMFEAISASDLTELSEEKSDFTVYLYKDTCAHCKAFLPKLEKCLQKNSATIYKVNCTNTEQEVFELLGEKYQGTPALYTFKDGEIIDYFIGNRDEEELTAFMQKNKQHVHIN